MSWSDPSRADARPASPPGEAVPLQLHTLRIGMRITLLAPLVAAAFLVLARREDVDMGAFALVFIAFAVTAGVATLLPYERLFRAGLGMAGLYVWSAVNLLVIAVGIWATGGSGSPLVFLYALTTLFFAVAFSTRAQAVFFALTIATYGVIVGPTEWDLLHVAVLAVLAFLANLLVGQLKRQMEAHVEARSESERRWALLAVVSAAGQRMSAVESLSVLHAVVDSVVSLGFPASRIYVREDDEYRPILPPGTPSDFPDGIASLPAEAIELALREGRTVTVEDPVGADRLRSIGLVSACIVPISNSDRAEALLVVGVEALPGPSPQDVEVFQMLATQAAVALENAQRFEQQRRSMERIAEVDRMKSDFLSSVSHELRTPLTVIAGMGRTLEESWDRLPEEDRRDLIARLNANAASLDTMIAELLDFGRLESGQLQVEPLETDVRALLTGVVDRLSSLFRHHVVSVEVEEGLTAYADPLLIERVVENLLTNAAKYTPPRSHVVVAAQRDDDEAIVSVTDDGPGIPSEELCHIGERFFRGGDANTRSTRGTGLGLALVSEVLDLHGTYLEVESRVGKGSRFAFRLPLDVAPHTTARNRDRITAPAPSTTAVVVSDDRLPGERFETLLAAARTGLEWAVGALFREFHPRVLRYLRAQMPDDAEQLALATWNDIASGLPSFEGDEGAFRRWVFAIARGRLVDARQRAGSTGASEPGRTGAGTPRRSEGGSPSVDAALARIGSLEPDQADVILLRSVGGLDVFEVAEITGDPPEVVRVAEREGLRRLRDRRDESELPDPKRVRSGVEP